jgi:RHS repeat-associated protein
MSGHETFAAEGQIIHHQRRNHLTQMVSSTLITNYTYDEDGDRAKAAVNGVTTAYPFAHYEVEGSTVRKCYYRGRQRIIARMAGALAVKTVHQGSAVTTTHYVGGYYERAINGAARRYYRLGDQVVLYDGTAYHTLYGDHLNSATLTTNASGTKTSETRYYPYGAHRYDWGNDPSERDFTGQRRDAEIALLDYVARRYSPYLGRFVSPDSIVPQPGNPQSLNRYSYVLNNPLRYTDPTGHCATDENDVCDPVETRREYTRIRVRTNPHYAEARLVLANMIYGEQGGETVSFQVAAGYVAWNRAGHRLENVVSVVAAPNQFQGYQGPHIPNPQPTGIARQAWESIYNVVAPDVLTGIEPDPTGGALFFANIETEQVQVYADTLARQVQDKYPNENLSRGQALARAGYGSLLPGRLSATGHPLVYNRLEPVALQDYQVASPRSPLNVSPGTGPTRGTRRHPEVQP